MEGISDLFKNLGKQLTSALGLPADSLFPNDYGQQLKESLSAVEITGATAYKIINAVSESVVLPNIPTYNSETDEDIDEDDSDNYNYNRRRR